MSTSDSSMVARPKLKQRAHRKSRLGCKVCKERKIKCDELRPFCGNCVRRFEGGINECSYDEHEPLPRRQRSKVPVNTSLSLSPPCLSLGTPTPSLNTLSHLLDYISPFQSPSFSVSHSSSHSHWHMPLISRPLELRLFHHYSTQTCHTLPLSAETIGLQMWSRSIPQLSFTCPYIYSCILAFAALHILSASPFDANDDEHVLLEMAAYQCVDDAIAALKVDMRVLGKGNSVNVFTASALLAIQTKIRWLVVVKSERKRERERRNEYVLPLNYFRLHSGARRIFEDTRGFIEGSDVKAWSEWRPDILHFPTSSTATSAIVPFPWPHDALLDIWASLPPSTRTPYHTSTYASALSYLSLLKHSIDVQEPRHWVQRRFSILTSEVPEGFLVLLEQRDGLALVILARIFALLKFVDQSWWMSGTAEWDVNGVKGLVGEEWEWAMVWPSEVVRAVREVHWLR